MSTEQPVCACHKESQVASYKNRVEMFFIVCHYFSLSATTSNDSPGLCECCRYGKQRHSRLRGNDEQVWLSTEMSETPNLKIFGRDFYMMLRITFNVILDDTIRVLDKITASR
jgi:hypothetical protein